MLDRKPKMNHLNVEFVEMPSGEQCQVGAIESMIHRTGDWEHTYS
jgi:hypothetical protein